MIKNNIIVNKLIGLFDASSTCNLCISEFKLYSQSNIFNITNASFGSSFNIGYSKSPHELFFKGYISDIKMWDKCLTEAEIKNLHKKIPQDSLVFDFDFDNEVDGLENVEIVKEKIEIPHTILPYRRDGKFKCLPHQTEGLINVGGIDRWAKGETTAANERRYVLQMQQGEINYKVDGMNSMQYELLSIDTIYDRHKMINVKA